jgi:hypothetical protein
MLLATRSHSDCGLPEATIAYIPVLFFLAEVCIRVRREADAVAVDVVAFVTRRITLFNITHDDCKVAQLPVPELLIQ